jgi:predicted Zn-dependent protease
MKMKWKQALSVSLILSLMLLVSVLGEAQAQTQYSLDLQGLTWNHSTISVLVVPQDNASWWKSSYLNATLRAISEWNNAIVYFARNYSNFAYLSSLRMIPTISHAMNSGFDVYISWIETSLNTGANEIGDTQTVYEQPYTIIKSTITLAAKDSQGYVLNEADMQNVALHELGHSLGLGHSSYLGDVMYPHYTPKQTVEGLSTLDVYGVSTVFQWMSKSSQFNPVSSVTLPSNIPYQYLPISNENLPPPSSTPSPTPYQTVLTYIRTLLTYILQFFLRPEFSIPLLIAILALLVTEFVVATHRRRKEPQEIPTSTCFHRTSRTISVHVTLQAHLHRI